MCLCWLVNSSCSLQVCQCGIGGSLSVSELTELVSGFKSMNEQAVACESKRGSRVLSKSVNRLEAVSKSVIGTVASHTLVSWSAAAKP